MQVTVIGSKKAAKTSTTTKKKICTDTRLHCLRLAGEFGFFLAENESVSDTRLESRFWSRFSNRERTQIRLWKFYDLAERLSAVRSSRTRSIWPERFETRAARVDSASDEREIRGPARRYFLWPRNVTVGNRSSSNISSSSNGDSSHSRSSSSRRRSTKRLGPGQQKKIKPCQSERHTVSHTHTRIQADGSKSENCDADCGCATSFLYPNLKVFRFLLKSNIIRNLITIRRDNSKSFNCRNSLNNAFVNNIRFILF